MGCPVISLNQSGHDATGNTRYLCRCTVTTSLVTAFVHGWRKTFPAFNHLLPRSFHIAEGLDAVVVRDTDTFIQERCRGNFSLMLTSNAPSSLPGMSARSHWLRGKNISRRPARLSPWRRLASVSASFQGVALRGQMPDSGRKCFTRDLSPHNPTSYWVQFSQHCPRYL